MADQPVAGPFPTVPLTRRTPGDPAALAALVDRLPAAVLALDPAGRLTWLNAAAERLLGALSPLLLGRVLAEVPGTAGRALASAGAEAADTGEPVTVQAAGGWYEVRAARAEEGLALTVSDVSRRRTVQERADRSAARATLLVRVAAELSGALDGVSALGRLARLVVPVLTDGCVVTVVDRDGRARDVGSWHADPDRRDLLARYARVRLDTLPPSSPVGRALRTGEPVSSAVTDVLALMSDDGTREMLRALRAESVVVLPLPAESRTVGVLSLYLDAGRQVSAEDLATARAVAVQAGRAIDRVGRQSRQIQLAEALQRSLLTDPPDFPGVEVVVRYVPAAEAARVGGDWYDAFRHPDGDAVVVIGDVVGHDTAAAAAMGQLRGLVRGIAHSSRGGPAEVLRGLDEAMATMHAGTLATAAVARLERGGTRLRWANAGHPPPVLLWPGGRVEALAHEEADLLLGVDPEAERREDVVALAPGTTVLLHTDGLVERRGSTLDEGTERLHAALAELAGAPLPQLCDELLARLLEGTPQDDVAVVAFTVRPPV
ncbi:SpoIIE family protein phosphatase [Geodermatophilus sp. SYSU D01106]|uniref:SpoIIE family protein phosphatase n=1 Tax=Geodermatophilus sp. FMUSA9-8 TaxID=3120155 RepID=UPI00300A02F8